MKRLWWLGVPILAVAGFWFLGRNPPPALPSWATAPAGTELRDGYKVPEGAVQLGPVLQPSSAGQEWNVILAVTGDPLEVWEKLLGQLARRYPSLPVDPGSRQGCRTDDEEGFG